MKGTFILNFRPWSAINPPLPRTPQESRKLLNALTSSFRRQLDREYPLFHHGHQSTDEMPANPNSSVHVTDRHLSSILDNPLFRVVPSKNAAPSSSSHKSPGEPLNSIMSDPMAALDNMLASGSANIPTVVTCLQSQLRLASKVDAADPSRVMKESKAASRVLTWFWASDPRSRKMILDSHPLQALLMKFVAAQGLQNLVMEWILALLKDDAGGWTTEPGWQNFARMLIYFTSAEMNFGNGLGSAVEYYLYANRELSNSSELSAKQLRRVGRNIGQWMIENAQGQTKEISAATYDNFISVAFAMDPKELWSVAVPVYHPTHPNVRRFVKFAKTLPVHTYRSWKQKKKDAFQRVSIDAMRLLLDRGGSQQAVAVGLAQSVLGLDELPNEKSPGRTTAMAPTAVYEEILLNRLSSTLG